MKALVLTAGFGTRLQPFTHSYPKPLVPVHGIPLLLYTLSFLKKNGIRDIILNLHHQGSKIQNYLKNGEHLGLNIRYSHEQSILGTGGGIRKASRLAGHDDLLVINGDVIADFDLKEFLAQHKKNRPVATLGLLQRPNQKDYGVLQYKKNQLTSLLGHPPAPQSHGKAMFSGFHILHTPSLKPTWTAFDRDAKFCIVRDVYMPLMDQQQNFGAYLIKGFWAVCDSLIDVKATEKRLSQRKLSYESQLRKLFQASSERHHSALQKAVGH